MSFFAHYFVKIVEHNATMLKKSRLLYQKGLIKFGKTLSKRTLN